MATRQLSIFTTTFNLNGSLPSLADVRLWLQGQPGQDAAAARDEGEHHQGSSNCSASDADLVVICLQECPTAATAVISASRNNGAEIGPIIFLAGISDPTNNFDDEDAAFLGNIRGVLSEEHDLVADLSMGAKSNHADAHVESGDVKWYGYVRLLMFARNSELVTELRQGSVGVAVAVGTKPMSRKNQIRSNHMLSDRTRYHALGSPDKGAVCLMMPAMKLMVVCAHLAGTNKYGVPERTFDRIRHEQLRIISGTLEESIRNVGDGNETIDAWEKIVSGDLNFRVEVYNEAEHKCRGGDDWMAVADVLQGGGKGEFDFKRQDVVELFRGHDRLVQYLENGALHLIADPDAEITGDYDTLPKLLGSMVDLVHFKCFSGADTCSGRGLSTIMPTFSLQIESDDVIAGDDNNDEVSRIVSRRLYSNKRTPSWPDRILMSRKLVENETRSSIVAVGSCPDVGFSDHCPVWSFTGCSHDVAQKSAPALAPRTFVDKKNSSQGM
mmetsp:Transcript_20273/g.58196  ORF Transcript_20273/g.58196 Transcript_20273/m.58196 type:complete len:498 (+) Transcript_20273:197-1690(+)|eukprot:CAMPEP_0181030368 /NCGR_PEP_ID=MMETSP1070-20121207/5685_1 /TAXON_ID=265543 /ORGANISM="Minutocellus polymorphus, Strain NH13" /LENGTH=497 /DNA_ID=CAMNT_0023107721 /DNA_START=178 /DNA_END=1671 /DNA_ORIENTATION=+